MYAGSMAEGGRDPGIQSDTASEAEQHSSPLDTIGSMSQSLMDLHPPKQRDHALAERHVITSVSDGVRLSFLLNVRSA